MTTTPSSYEQEIIAWRAAAERTLRADDGWLTVVGLFWLREGPNTIGSDDSCDIVLPAPTPALLGRIDLAGETATLHVAADAAATINREPAGDRELRSDVPGPPDLVTSGDVTFFLIRRGERLGVRVRDRNSQARRDFGGRRWFPIREEYRVDAQFVAYDAPRTLAITNILGDAEDMPAVGYVLFQLHGQEVRLEAVGRKDGGLWFIIRDRTSGRETYPAARFLYTSPPQDGRVTLDFNRAVSPPCAFTDYATCPLPPQQNHMPLPVEAGEQWGPRHHAI